jgi:hypothetical protein
MPLIEKPGPFKNGDRASKKVSAGVEQLKQDTGIHYTTQENCILLDLPNIAPDETKFPIICRHWPISPNQKSDAGRGGVA